MFSPEFAAVPHPKLPELSLKIDIIPAAVIYTIPVVAAPAALINILALLLLVNESGLKATGIVKPNTIEVTFVGVPSIAGINKFTTLPILVILYEMLLVNAPVQAVLGAEYS